MSRGGFCFLDLVYDIVSIISQEIKSEIKNRSDVIWHVRASLLTSFWNFPVRGGESLIMRKEREKKQLLKRWTIQKDRWEGLVGIAWSEKTLTIIL